MAKLTAEAKKMIAEFRPALVATAGKDGKPNVCPKGSLRALDDENLVFAEMGKVHTLANIKENPKVNVLVFNPATRTGMRIWGTAQIVESGYLFDAVRSAMAQTMKVDHVVKIKVEEEMPLKLG